MAGISVASPMGVLVLAVALAGGCSRSEERPAAEAAPEDAEETAAAPADEPLPLLEALGGHSHPITTPNPRAQKYFDQGLALTYGFNHEAAVDSFREALRLDPGCAMCAWGVAYALGPNINRPLGPESAREAHAAARKALSLLDEESEAERAWVEAVARRYVAEPAEDRAALDRAFADAMGEVYRLFPDDVDAATLYAESLMDLSPWDYWTPEGEPRDHTVVAVDLIESVLERQPDHLGANHYYIHLMEKHHPEKAVPSADRLAALGLEAGHLVHMPSHIYWRVGRYDDALDINQRAVAADEAFFARCTPGVFYRSAYYPHNIHFLWAAAATEGRSELAITTARKLAAETRDGIDELDFLEEFSSIAVLTLVRFGRWDEVLGEPAPPEDRRYLTGIRHYARGVALSRTGRADEAEAELAQLRDVAGEEAVESLLLAGMTASASSLLDIGVAHLEGEIAAARGETEAAARVLRRAVSLQDDLVYMEPPPWYFPTRQALGAVLLEAGRAAEAEAVYRKDLEQYPGNGWSLFGLARSLRAQGEEAEAEWAEQGFANAWDDADVELVASRF